MAFYATIKRIIMMTMSKSNVYDISLNDKGGKQNNMFAI